ncbi:hypothetical protein SRHO_G00271090, partial [Serrasalmus rhombeus]
VLSACGLSLWWPSRGGWSFVSLWGTFPLRELMPSLVVQSPGFSLCSPQHHHCLDGA